MPHISPINIYPVKSMRGLSVDHAGVERRGLAHDRRWMIVDESGVFLSQRPMQTLDFRPNDKLTRA